MKITQNIENSLSLVEQKDIEAKLMEYQEIFKLLPVNTQKAYNADMKHFLLWCEENNVDSLKPDLAHNKFLLKKYFSNLIESDLSKATIARRKTPISKFINILEWPNPFEQALFKEWYGLLLKQKSSFQEQAPALKIENLIEINKGLSNYCPMQLRDKVLLNIMFDGLLRASELCELQCKDISFVNKTMFIAGGKTDQEKRGSYRVLSKTSLDFIAIWKSKFNVSDGYLLRSLTPSKKVTERGVKYSTVYDAYKRFALMVDIDNKAFSGHSARIGAAVTLAENGVSLLDIQRSGNWKSPIMVARYTEQVTIHNNGMGQFLKNIER